jgi:hypothetical protein
MNANIVVYTYLAYLAISIGLTIWVARTLFKHGRLFLVDTFHGNEPLADSVNHLLVVGFYLVNIGYVSLALRFGDRPDNLQGAIEILSTKVGLVLLVLGVMHFGNLKIFNAMRRGALAREQMAKLATPPVIPMAQCAGGGNVE